MQEFPHHYNAIATAGPEGDVSLSSTGLEVILSAPPTEFGGPGNRWSPEELLVAAIADCFVLSFRAIARASKLSWRTLDCQVAGTLDRNERTVSFTVFNVEARLVVSPDVDQQKAQRLLEKAEASCLITNSLSGITHLATTVVVES